MESVLGSSTSQIRYGQDPIYILSLGPFKTGYNSLPGKEKNMFRLGFRTSESAYLLYLLANLVPITAGKVAGIGSYRASGLNLRKLSIVAPQTLPLINLSGVILFVSERFSARGYCPFKVAMQMQREQG